MQKEDYLEEFPEIVENTGNEVLTEGETFLQRLESKEKKRIIESYIKTKKNNTAEGNGHAQKIADIARQVSESEYVKIDDDTSLTIGEILVANAFANEMANPRATFATLNNAQKVIDNDVNQNVGGFTVNFITNGQDLGD